MPFAYFVECHAEVAGQATHLDPPHRRQYAGRKEDRFVFGLGAETKAHTGEFGVVVAAVLADLLHGDRGGPAGEAQCRIHQGVTGEARVDTVDVERRVALPARLLQWFTQPCVGEFRCDQPDERRSYDVRPGTQEADQVGHGRVRARLRSRGVHDAVSLQRNEFVDVGCRDHSGGRGDAAEIGGIAPDFVRRCGVHPDEFEIRAPDDRPERVDSDVTGGELNDAAGQCLSFRVGR